MADLRIAELGPEAGLVGAADLARRDKFDSSRAADPLRQASDAIEVDTTGLGIDEVVAVLLDLLNSKVSS